MKFAHNLFYYWVPCFIHQSCLIISAPVNCCWLHLQAIIQIIRNGKSRASMLLIVTDGKLGDHDEAETAVSMCVSVCKRVCVYNWQWLHSSTSGTVISYNTHMYRDCHLNAWMVNASLYTTSSKQFTWWKHANLSRAQPICCLVLSMQLRQFSKSLTLHVVQVQNS